MVRGMPLIQHVDEFCDGCALGKQHRTPFPQATTYRASRALELVHGELCGPITPPTAGGKKYFLLIVDDYTRFMWLEVLRSKDEALQFFKKVKARAEAECSYKLLAFRSDRGGEFNSTDFTEFCDDNGVKHNTTAPYSPQQNDVVERRNQTVVEMARCLPKSVNMPGPFWGEAVKTAVYLLNRASSRSLNGTTLYEAWHGRTPNVRHLKIFGCVAHVKRLGPGINKLADRSIMGVFVGYEDGSKAYRVYDPVGKRLYITRDVAFEESRAWD
jgi:transposase InsO family protein